MRYIFLLLLLSCVGNRNIIYSDVPPEFFLDKWWELGENQFFEAGTCFLLDSGSREILIDYPDYFPYAAATWVYEDDYILLEDLDGFDVSLWLYGSCGDYSVIASTSLFVDESKLYECKF
jgi:hypothetical protein